MTRSRSLWLLVLLLPAAASLVWARQVQPNVPGMPTRAEVTVVNTGTDPIPVILSAAGGAQPVTIVGAPAVALAADATVGTRAVRQPWEYRTVDVVPDGDVAGALDEAGKEGWEAVGVMSAGGGASRILLKRPR